MLRRRTLLVGASAVIVLLLALAGAWRVLQIRDGHPWSEWRELPFAVLHLHNASADVMKVDLATPGWSWVWDEPRRVAPHDSEHAFAVAAYVERPSDALLGERELRPEDAAPLERWLHLRVRDHCAQHPISLAVGTHVGVWLDASSQLSVARTDELDLLGRPEWPARVPLERAPCHDR